MMSTLKEYNYYFSAHQYYLNFVVKSISVKKYSKALSFYNLPQLKNTQILSKIATTNETDSEFLFPQYLAFESLFGAEVSVSPPRWKTLYYNKDRIMDIYLNSKLNTIVFRNPIYYFMDYFHFVCKLRYYNKARDFGLISYYNSKINTTGRTYSLCLPDLTVFKEISPGIMLKLDLPKLRYTWHKKFKISPFFTLMGFSLCRLNFIFFDITCGTIWLQCMNYAADKIVSQKI